jgi:two-component system sensor histidine kinase KdpD
VKRFFPIIRGDRPLRDNFLRAALTAGILAATSALGLFLDGADFPQTDIALTYCLAVIVIAWLTHNFIFSLIATGLATVAFNFFFTDPFFTFSVYDKSYIMTFITLAIAALLASSLTLHARRSAQIARQKEEETEQERYRANLLRSISHDIRTPLSAIIGTAEMLEGETESSDPRRGLINGIRDEADWLRSLVENVLSLTRLQDGSRALPKQPEAVEEIVGGAVRHIAKRSPERGIEVRIPDELLMIPMDAKLIEQVLINLLDNAVRCTAPGDGISVAVEKGDGEVRFSVLDEGTGIGEEHLPNLFKTFYTTRARHADAGHGIGLGLSICETIVKAHGGSITARNRPDRSGAEFVFTLPTEDGKHGTVQ